MNRKTKNIIMSIALVGTIGLTGVTGYFAHNNSSSAQVMNGMPSASGNSNSSEPPEMPSNNQSSNSNDSSSNSSSSNSSSSDSSTNTNQPPEMPSNSQSSNSNDTSNNSSSSSDTSSSDSTNTNQPPEMPSGNQSSQSTSSNIGTVYIILFGVESLAISSIVIYLIMSKGNKKSFKETFKNSDKIIIGALSVVLLTGGLTFTDTYAVHKLGNTNTPTQMNQSNTNVSYSASETIDSSSTISSGTYSSSTADENSLLVTGDQDTTLSNITVNKTGDSDGGDSTSFYGNNSAILAKDGANLTIKNATITTNATGANGVFSYGGSATTNNTNSDGTTVTISDSTITTKKDNSGGIMVTGGGILKATNLTVNTAGVSSAAIRSDRGGGTLTVNKGTYTTTGAGSPAVYSTADITVKNATLVSKASEGVVIEGNNSVTLNNVKLTDTNSKLNGQSTTYKNIFLYQSQSGDASDGNSTFTSKNSTITTNKGDTFYITNTTATINLTNNTIVNNDSSGNFLRAQADSWGTSGSNGGNVTLNMTNQEANGDIVIDSVSTLNMNMTSSSYTGTINGSNDAKSIKLVLDKDSTITLTGDSYVTSLEDEDTDYSNINFNGYKLYVNGKAIN